MVGLLDGSGCCRCYYGPMDHHYNHITQHHHDDDDYEVWCVMLYAPRDLLPYISIVLSDDHFPWKWILIDFRGHHVTLARVIGLLMNWGSSDLCQSVLLCVKIQWVIWCAIVLVLESTFCIELPSSFKKRILNAKKKGFSLIKFIANY